MSTEPNTQQCGCITDGEFIAKPCRKHAGFQPPPETGAADESLEQMAIRLSMIEANDPACHGQMLPLPQKMMFLASIIAPLTARISELEKKSDEEMLRVKACEAIAEGEKGWRQLCDICPSTMAVALLREQAEAAEARVKEVESTLETVTKGSFEASQAMAAVNAELRARVKELEGKLSAALKLTTAASMDHVSKLER